MHIEHIREELAGLNEVTPLEGQRYAACLDTYEAASNQRELILGFFTDHVIPELPTDNASFLSVGCGAGDLDVQILAAGKEHASRISYVGLEPDPQQCEKFVTRLESEGHEDIQVEAHNTRFEEFPADAANEQQAFDLVLMVHSLYYMDDPEQALDDALNLIGDSGQLVILIASNDKLNELSSSFWAMENDENGGSTWFSEDLSKHLEKRAVPFERKRIKGTLDITTCFEPDSEHGNRVADFVAQVPTGELPPRLRKMIFSYLEATSHSDGEKRWLPHNVDAFIIN